MTYTESLNNDYLTKTLRIVLTGDVGESGYTVEDGEKITVTINADLYSPVLVTAAVFELCEVATPYTTSGFNDFIVWASDRIEYTYNRHTCEPPCC